MASTQILIRIREKQLHTHAGATAESPVVSRGGPLSTDLSLCLLTLANHSYVDRSQVRRSDSGDGGEGVQCITDLATCCTSGDGAYRGDWYFPDGTILPFTAPDVDTFEVREHYILSVTDIRVTTSTYVRISSGVCLTLTRSAINRAYRKTYALRRSKYNYTDSSV